VSKFNGHSQTSYVTSDMLYNYSFPFATVQLHLWLFDYSENLIAIQVFSRLKCYSFYEF